jgi:hypothetical protein
MVGLRTSISIHISFSRALKHISELQSHAAPEHDLKRIRDLIYLIVGEISSFKELLPHIIDK